MVENEQLIIVDNNADLQVINQHDVDTELEKEQASSVQARTVPEWLINTLMEANSHFLYLHHLFMSMFLSLYMYVIY